MPARGSLLVNAVSTFPVFDIPCQVCRLAPHHLWRRMNDHPTDGEATRTMTTKVRSQVQWQRLDF